MNPNPLDALNHLTVRVRFWWSEKREREREAFDDDDDDEFTTKRRPDNRFQKQKKVIIKQFEREYKKRSRATFFRTHQRQFFSTSISNRRNLSPGVSFVIVLLSETDGEMCATFREMAVTFILLLYFTFSVDSGTQANQFKSKNGAFWVVIMGSRICPNRSRFTLFFYSFFFAFFLLFAFCFLLFFLRINWIRFK